MEMAIGNTATPFFPMKLSRPPSFFNHRSIRFCAWRKTQDRKMVPMSVTGRFGSSRGGAGLLERPTFDQSQFDPITQVQEGGDIGRVSDKKGLRSGDSYRVLLVDDKRHTEQLVAKVIPQVVPSVAPDDARRLFHESRQQGVAVVVVAVKEHAEFYAQMMTRGGLRSAIEPDSDTA